MLEASFDPRVSRGAAIHGANQYDTGQRLRLCGLPGPDELSEADDLLGLSVAAVQVHFAYDGDAQSEPVLAQWDADRDAWMSVVPDEYLTRAEPVRVYVYVYYGADGESERAKTMYEGVFTPRSRTAPNNVATSEQLEWWKTEQAAVQLALAAAQTAPDKAKDAAALAQAAAKASTSGATAAKRGTTDANSARARLTAAGTAISGATYAAKSVAAGQPAAATRSGSKITLYIPTGETGATGPRGDTGPTGPSDVSFTVSSGNLVITTT